MRWSGEALRTLRANESEDLLVRAGLVLRDGTWTPFGERVLDKIRRMLPALPLAAERAELEDGEDWWMEGGGEDELLACRACGYRGVRSRPREDPGGVAGPEARRVETPGQKTVQGVAAMLGVPVDRLIKTLVMEAGGAALAVPLVVMVRGDRAVSLAKVRALAGGEAAMAGEELVRRVTGAPVGFAGPLGLTGVRMVGDHEVRGMTGAVTGANEADVHLVGVDVARDLQGVEWADVRVARAGDGCPRCAGTLARAKGRRLSSPARIAAAVVERHHDADGIVWPRAVAPVDVALISLAPKDAAVVAAADAIYQALMALGLEVLYDDREERPGVKFKDADLIGAPLRVTVGSKSLAEGNVELKVRATGAVDKLPLADAAARIKGERA